jgi:putative oxidoreductase
MTLSTTTRDFFAFLSRALIVLLFLPSGIEKVFGFGGTVGYITGHHVPMPELAAIVAVVVEVLFALLLLIGYQTRWVAVAFIVYVAVITPIFHPYWDVPAAQMMGQKINFYKNIAIIGGLFAILASGPGGWSVDAKQGRDRPVT